MTLRIKVECLENIEGEKFVMAVVKHIWVLTSLSGQDLVFKAVSPPAYLKIN